MNTSIQKSATQKASDNLVILTRKSGTFDKSVFTTSELKYVQSEIKKKSKFITVNQLKRFIFLQIIDSTDSDPRITEKFRKAGASLNQVLNNNKLTGVTLSGNVNPEHILAFAEGLCLANYQFLRYKSEKKVKSLKSIHILHSKVTAKEVRSLEIICESVCIARDLVNEPLNGLNAPKLAREYQKMGRKAGFRVSVFDKKKIQSMKMGGLLAVNRGSIDPPTFTIMEYKPARPKNKSPFVLVGKGVVYDTGGLSLKPTPNSMDYMKSDMGGAAIVGSAIYAIAKMKLPVHVIALVPATDNRPDGNAYVPGDVIKMFNGMTVEVLNTDAEGRMILADALHYAKRYKPGLVLEFSTLTGAAANAVGPYGIVCMGDADDKTKAQLKKSGDNVYERLVEFPFWDEYDHLLDSNIADIKNIGGAIGGAITAGRFLSKFTDYPYMHFDVAGPTFLKTNDSYRGMHGSGIGVRLLCDFFMKASGS